MPATLRRFLIALVALAVCVTFLVGVTRVDASASRSRPTLLVVGSIVAQAATDLVALKPSGVTVWVASGLGSALCDWTNGYRDPFTHQYKSFSSELAVHDPSAVAIAFSGNPGLSGPAHGCVNANTRYTLDALVASYSQAITQMAIQASATGAAVYLDAVVARNPATALGVYGGTSAAQDYGFNGAPQLNDLLLSLSSGPAGQPTTGTTTPLPPPTSAA
jgi:hypothetical protein